MYRYSVTSSLMKRKRSCPIRWAMLFIRPVIRLSRQTTSCPSSMKRSHRWEPRNPEPPVISVRGMELLSSPDPQVFEPHGLHLLAIEQVPAVQYQGSPHEA